MDLEKIVSVIYMQIYVYINIDIFGQIHINLLVGVAVSIGERIDFLECAKTASAFCFTACTLNFFFPLLLLL